MQPTETECPRCESPQKFVVKERPTEHRWNARYIRCGICRWEKVLEFTTPEIELAKDKLRGWSKRADDETMRHGTPTRQTFAKLRLYRGELAMLQAKLQADVNHVNNPAAYADAA